MSNVGKINKRKKREKMRTRRALRAFGLSHLIVRSLKRARLPHTSPQAHEAKGGELVHKHH